MKTDVVLTMDEYLVQSCPWPKPVSEPAPDARHLPITIEGDIGLKGELRARRCERWGHLCPDCFDKGNVQTRSVRRFAFSKKVR
jgi:hypothetical protein